MNAPQPRSNKPLIQALSLIVAAGSLLLAFVLGAVVLVVLFAVGAIVAVAIAVRVWWLQRKLRRAAAEHAEDPSTPRVLEGDYTVVSETDAAHSRGPDAPRSLPRDERTSQRRDEAD